MSVAFVKHEYSDIELIHLAKEHDESAICQIVKRYNQRLYRLARALTGNDTEAEDVVQEAYLQAFTHLDTFLEKSSLATWLSRITINIALTHIRSNHRLKRAGNYSGQYFDGQFSSQTPDMTIVDPERSMAQREILQRVEHAADALPEPYRMVFVARVIEGLSIEETSALLDLNINTVRTRLHRARKLIKEQLEFQIGPFAMEAFPFAGMRCERLTKATLLKLNLLRMGT